MSEGMGQDVASYSACRFMHALGFFWLVLILSQFSAVEGLDLKNQTFLFMQGSSIDKLKLFLYITL